MVSNFLIWAATKKITVGSGVVCGSSTGGIFFGGGILNNIGTCSYF
jgi:hypothetical protein